MIVKRPGEITVMQLVCDKCKKGIMKPTGSGLAGNPPQNQYRCEKLDCGATTYSPIVFPIIDIKEAEPFFPLKETDFAKPESDDKEG